MKSILSLVLAGSSLLVVGTAHGAADRARQYEIKSVVIEEIQDTDKTKVMAEQIGNFTDGCQVENSQLKPFDGDPIDAIGVIVDKIINIGKKIWAIVDAGRPVVNIKVDTANALPAGVKCWDELEGWQAPISKLYKASYKNGFNSTVVSYAFRVGFISGGSYKGQGKYITLASVQPADVHVSWGFRLDAQATVPMVFNQGTKADPLAGMQLAMNWQVKSPLTEIQRAENFFINAVGTLDLMK
jgi:hypothetical protein